MTYEPSVDPVRSTIFANITEAPVSSPPWSGDSTFIHSPRTAITNTPFAEGSWARSLPAFKNLFRSKKETSDESETETEKQQREFTSPDADVTPDEKTPWHQTSQRWLL